MGQHRRNVGIVKTPRSLEEEPHRDGAQAPEEATPPGWRWCLQGGTVMLALSIGKATLCIQLRLRGGASAAGEGRRCWGAARPQQETTANKPFLPLLPPTGKA